MQGLGKYITILNFPHQLISLLSQIWRSSLAGPILNNFMGALELEILQLK